MKKINFHGTVGVKNVIKVASFFMFFAFTLLSFTGEAGAQTSVDKTGDISPSHSVSRFANHIGVNVATLGSWDLNKVIPALTQKLNALDKNSTNVLVRFKVSYYTVVLQEITKYDVYPEISTLSAMKELSEKFNNPAITVAEMKNLYISSTNSF